MKISNILGYDVFSDDLEAINLNTNCIINTINPHSYVTAKKDALFKEALIHSNVLLPDGTGMTYASRILNHNRLQRITGFDIHDFILRKINAELGKVCYLGSTDETLQLIVSRLKRDSPNVQVSVYSPPFKPVFSEKENMEIISHINTFKPDILFIGMTAPKQEKWVFENKEQIKAGVICSIGAVFDFYAGTIKRPPHWMIKLKLEWLGRFLNEPKRMWKRNFISTPMFVKDILFTKLRINH